MGSCPESGQLALDKSGLFGGRTALPAETKSTRLLAVRVRAPTGRPEAPAATRWSGIQT